MSNMDVYILLVLVLVSSAGSTAKATDCRFPIEWQGMWYESSLKTFEIRQSSITNKGTCLEREDFREAGKSIKFLMLKKAANNRKCFQCLVFTERHPNLLQYKMSQCWHEDSLTEVCGRISGDESLQTIVKVPSLPEACPFQGSYSFSYTNGTIGLSQQCASPISEIRACADESKFRFVYRRCSEVHSTFDQEWDFQCLATWRNGEKYLFGKFSSPAVHDESNMYRCFMHTFYGTTGEMSMSGDSTCQGLQSPSLGVITMKLSKEISSWSRGSCKFPDILSHQSKWRDLSGRFGLELDEGFQSFRIKDRFPHGTMPYSTTSFKSTIRYIARCVQERQNGNKTYVAFMTNDSCFSEHRCLQIRQRSTSVLELLIGNQLESLDEKCHYSDASKYLLIPEDAEPSACPQYLHGIYRYIDKKSDCTGSVDIGCENEEEISIERECPVSTEKESSVDYLQCLDHWSEGSVTRVIAKKPSISSNDMVCLTFTGTEFGLEMQSDATCDGDRRVVLNRFLNYLLYTPPGSCRTQIIKPNVQSDRAVDSNKRIIIDGDNSDNSHSNSLHMHSCAIYLSLLTLAFVLCGR